MRHFSNLSLYHISEDPTIEQFHPRPDKSGNKKVWAITAPRIQNYLFPRNCPRVCIWADKSTTGKDLEQLANFNTIIFIEESWFERAKNITLYAYRFDPTPFCLEDENAGYYTATTPQTPFEKRTIVDPLAQLNVLKTHLVVQKNLHALKEKISRSSFAYSMIRMRNCTPTPPTQI